MSVRCILVGVDESDGSQPAIEWAAELAADLGARVVAVHVYEPLRHLQEIGPDRDFADVRQKVFEDLADSWCAPFDERGVEVERRVVEGIPHQAVLRAADDAGADLIVVGARRLGIIRTALGSTSYRIVHDSSIPVTVIHA